ncbi:endonuclease domain-containing protein [Catenulispora pinisilvae]|uniref:endonuclease domain-containing protein n=1 Tax=Catenulispora pinisilvae TaxID=2705253 RepID=UPI0018927014|nr:endonuclease domain-containing protein [Catenulispora pinisilvae]
MTVLAPLPAGDGMCSFQGGCRKAAEDEGLCASHLLVDLDGRPLAPLVLQVSTARAAEMRARGVSWCSLCQQELPLANFTIDGSGKREGMPRSRCRLCSGMVTRAKKFNRTLGDIARLFVFQEYRCAICKDEHRGDVGLHLDHDHACKQCPSEDEMCGKCIRGLLCWSCNSFLIGWYETKGNKLGKYEPAEEYLRNFPVRRMGLT